LVLLDLLALSKVDILVLDILSLDSLLVTELIVDPVGKDDRGFKVMYCT
jgi:hypothetical protein